MIPNGDFNTPWSQGGTHDCIVVEEDGVVERQIENIFTPPGGWKTWFDHRFGFSQPEVTDTAQISDPRRTLETLSMRLFAFHRPVKGGFLNTVPVEPGTKLRFSAMAHAWSNHEAPDFFWCWNCHGTVVIPPGEDWAPCPECETGINRDCALVFPHPSDGLWSEGAGYDEVRWLWVPEPSGDPQEDAKANAEFRVGIDPTGGQDPTSKHIVWGSPAWIYNKYAPIPEVEATAIADEVTVYMMYTAQYAFKHNDSYWDMAVMEAMGQSEPVPPDPVEWNYPVFSKGTRLGVHGIWHNQITPFAQALVNAGTKFPVVKVVNDMGWIAGIREHSPDTILVGRYTSPYEGCQDVEFLNDAELHQLAANLINVIMSKSSSELRAIINYWEISNEPDPNSVPGYYRLGQLMIICMELAEELGLKLALLGLNGGTPEWDEMQALADSGMFQKAKEGGHILALHEGTFETYDPQQWWDGSIPGSLEVEGAGALNFRYRFLYHLLEQRNEVIPLLVSEWYCSDVREGSVDVETIVNAFRWYDQEASKDYYFWAACPFTLGTGAPPDGMWWFSNWERFYEGGLIGRAIEVANRQNALPPQQAPPKGRGDPRIDYPRTYNVIRQDATLEEAVAVFTEGWLRGKETAGGSPDDAGIGDLSVRNVNLYNLAPEKHDAYDEFFETYYEGVNLAYAYLDGYEDVPWDVDITDELPRRYDLPQWPDGRWPHRELSILERVTNHHLGALIGDLHAHCAAYLNKGDGRPAYAYTFVIQKDGTIVKCLHLDEGNWHDHSGKSHRHLCVGLNGALHKYPPTEEQFQSMVRLNAWAIRHPEMIITYDDHSRITGHEDWYPTQCPGWSQWASGHWREEFYERLDAEMEVLPPPPSPPPPHTLVGVHDEPGGAWLQGAGVKGCCLVLCQVHKTPREFNFQHLKDQVVIARVNWGYADGSGSLPRPEDRNAWIEAVVQTIRASRGVDGWIIGNEDNNPTEWPGGYPHPTHIVSPQYYIDTYNPIAAAVCVPLAPTALDPYNVVAQEFGQPGDPKDWADAIYAGISRYDFIALHAKTQTNDPEEIGNGAEFTDPPLIGRKIGLETIEDQRKWIPQTRAIYVTELNPQYGPGPGGLGWEPENAEWIQKSYAYMAGQGVNGVMYYRYELSGGGQEGFALVNKPTLLEAIRTL